MQLSINYDTVRNEKVTKIVEVTCNKNVLKIKSPDFTLSENSMEFESPVYKPLTDQAPNQFNQDLFLNFCMRYRKANIMMGADGTVDPTVIRILQLALELLFAELKDGKLVIGEPEPLPPGY
jgi:hypothetical protein